MKKSALQKLCFSMLSTSFVLLTGCGEEKPTLSLLPETNNFQQSADSINNKLDILWVIDNSGSMQPYQNNIATNFNAFLSQFVGKGYDFKISVTVTDAWRTPYVPDPNLAKFRDGTNGTSHTGVFVALPDTPNLLSVLGINLKQGINGNGDERAFSSFKEALNSNLNAGFLRPDSFLAVIIVSDEDDFSYDGAPYINRDYNYPGLHTVQHYIDYLDTLTGTTGANRRYSVSSMAVIDPACQAAKASTGSIIGQRYMDIANGTGGVLGSLCSTNFANELDQIQNKIAELSTQFHLTREPVISSIKVKVNSVLIPESMTNGWSYEAEAMSIRFHGSAIPQQGDSISVDFDPVTIK